MEIVNLMKDHYDDAGLFGIDHDDLIECLKEGGNEPKQQQNLPPPR